MGFSILMLSLIFLHFLSSSEASPSDHSYNVGDEVPLFVNKVGPLNNPSETYQYYEMPFCLPDQVLPKKESLGEVLNGDRLTNSLYELKFKLGKTDAVLCQKKFNRNDIAKFRGAIENDYYFQMYYDDLPLWGFIGKVEDNNWALDGRGPTHFLFKHIQFNVLHSSNQIIEIHAFSDPNNAVDITDDVDLDITFTYSVFWNGTSTPFRNRMNRYSRASLLPVHQKIHWFSFLNSVVIIVLLIGLLAFPFTRNLRNDLRSSRHPGEDEEEDKEVGWKYIHNDVFRCPPGMPLFCALLGTGTQLLTMVLVLFALAFIGILYPQNRGSLSTSVVIVYILTSGVAGYTSASFYSQFAETGWERSVLLAGMVFLGPFFFVFFILNLVAAYFGITAALPFRNIFVVVLVHVLVGIPFLALGGMRGYNFRSEFQESRATRKYSREIPSSTWYRTTPGQMFIGGLLPFGAVVLELNQLYASIWGYKIFTLPGILFITFMILILVTAILSISLTYFQLIVEDPEWRWRSFLRGGAIAVFMFVYSFYFYSKSNMSGFMQTAFYFGYSACMCYAFFLILGTISFYSSLIFVCRIYHAIKSE
ncbi:hypothetical protein ACH5RR_021130 [Cinchona calisaya]|uniref:Transmembrane 9 superfamily member n=1 Tax=Cinchona calisaya TaxID=153742 RepID=A0ABD2ZGE3_9GENT